MPVMVGRVQAGPAGQGAGAEGAVAGDHVQAFQVDVLEAQAVADVVVEQ
jgi:hypothetical protein